MSKSEYITFGTMAVSLAAVVAMSEDEFKAMFKGVIATDINEAWKEVLKHKPKSKVKHITKEDIFNPDGSVIKPKSKSKNKKRSNRGVF